jgi:integrase/recombinase XerD
MAGKSVALYLRIRTSNGSWSFAKAAFTKQNLPRRLYAVVDGTHEHHPEGVYHLRFQSNGKRTWQPIGKDASLALVALQNKATEIETGKPVADTQTVAESKLAIGPKPGDEVEYQPSGEAQRTAPEPEASTHPKTAERKLLSTAIDEYLEEKRLAGKKKKTLSAYTTALRYFQESFLKTYLDEVERVDMLRSCDCAGSEPWKRPTTFSRSTTSRSSTAVLRFRQHSEERRLYPAGTGAWR